jgi:hypothetical protein
MGSFRITDVRARMQGRLFMNLKGPGVGQLLPETYPLTRAATILHIFNTGRECYFETQGNIFMTDPTPFGTPPGTAGTGVVVVWDIRMPPLDNDPIEFVFGLANPADQTPTSGKRAATIVRMACAQTELKGVIAILSSAYVFYKNGSLQNTQYPEGIV